MGSVWFKQRRQEGCQARKNHGRRVGIYQRHNSVTAHAVHLGAARHLSFPPRGGGRCPPSRLLRHTQLPPCLQPCRTRTLPPACSLLPAPCRALRCGTAGWDCTIRLPSLRHALRAVVLAPAGQQQHHDSALPRCRHLPWHCPLLCHLLHTGCCSYRWHYYRLPLPLPATLVRLGRDTRCGDALRQQRAAALLYARHTRLLHTHCTHTQAALTPPSPTTLLCPSFPTRLAPRTTSPPLSFLAAPAYLPAYRCLYRCDPRPPRSHLATLQPTVTPNRFITRAVSCCQHTLTRHHYGIMAAQCRRFRRDLPVFSTTTPDHPRLDWQFAISTCCR